MQLFKNKTLTPPERERLKVALQSPAVEKFIAEQDAAAVAERKRLVEVITKVVKEAERPIAQAAKSHREAVAARETAERILAKAREDEVAAFGLLHGLTARRDQAIDSTEWDLRAGADKRLDYFRVFAREARDHARQRYDFSVIADRGDGNPGITWNTDEISRTLPAFDAAAEWAATAQLQALTTAEIDAGFARHMTAMRPLLRNHGLKLIEKKLDAVVRGDIWIVEDGRWDWND